MGLLTDALPPEAYGLKYDPDTGHFTRNGRRAGYVNRALGYVLISVGNKPVYAHRLAFAIMAGRSPAEVDHVNGDKSDNRWSNLREASHQENMCNSRKRADNASGFKGVCFFKRTRKWIAYINAGGKRLHLGYFPTAELAHEAYKAASRKHHGEFGRVA